MGGGLGSSIRTRRGTHHYSIHSYVALMRTRTLPLFGNGPPNGIAHNRKVRVFYTIRRVSRASCSAHRRNDVQAVHIEKCSIELIERHSWRDAIRIQILGVASAHFGGPGRPGTIGDPSCTIPPRARVVVPRLLPGFVSVPGNGSRLCIYVSREFEIQRDGSCTNVAISMRPPARYIQQTILNVKRASK